MTQPVSSVATGLPVAANPATVTSDNTTLSSKAFLQLLVAQLKYQDPTKPMDTAAFMQETATLTQVQAAEQTAQVNLDMLSAQRAQTASSLVGQTVTYAALDGNLVTGYVSAATISTAKPTLRIGTTDVELNQIQQVLAHDPAAGAP
jgi:flagellar basal-body rod modification protein FlgD